MRSRWMARISVAAAVTALCAAAVPAPAFAAGAPPAAPVLVSPASGATAPPGTPLTVQASDPDDASVEVVFHGAPRGTVQPPGVGDPFTFAVLPDTQNYVITPTNNPIMTAQAQWFVAQRDPLDIAFVAGVGDVVDNYTSDAQWTRASDNLAIMDAGGVPNSVLPGNHARRPRRRHVPLRRPTPDQPERVGATPPHARRHRPVRHHRPRHHRHRRHPDPRPAFQVDGTNPTTLRARAWPAAATEPTTWQTTATDTSRRAPEPRQPPAQPPTSAPPPPTAPSPSPTTTSPPPTIGGGPPADHRRTFRPRRRSRDRRTD